MSQDEPSQTNRILVPSGQIYDGLSVLTFTSGPQPNFASRSSHPLHQQTEDRLGFTCTQKDYGNYVVGHEGSNAMQEDDLSGADGVTLSEVGIKCLAQEQHMEDGVIKEMRKAPPDGNSEQTKRPRAPNWTNKETKLLLKLKRQVLMGTRRRGERVISWSKEVSKLLYEKYGYDRSHESCQQRWDTLLKDFKAICGHDSQINLGGSNCIPYWIMNENQRSMYDKLPRAFPEDWYESMDMIILIEGDNDLVKKNLRLKKGTKRRNQKNANIASTSTQNPSSIPGPSSSQDQVSMIPPVASCIPKNQGHSQQYQDGVYEGVSDATDKNDLIATITAIVSKQIEPFKSALRLDLLANPMGDAIPYCAQAGVIDFNVDRSLEHGHWFEDFNFDRTLVGIGTWEQRTDV